MELKEVFKNRRSIRNFKSEPIDMELIQRLIQDSILAPNAGNEQPWKFIVVSNRDLINRISDDCKHNFLQFIKANPTSPAKKYEKMLSNESFNIFYHAPVVVYILGNAGKRNLVADCSLAASYLMMSATDKDLGTCWVNFGMYIKDSTIREEMGLNDDLQIVAPIALGYPEKIPGIPVRKEPQILKIIE
ncbi:MAG: nitroreductase family protein [Salinivirgaceae bacterium]|nr:MAG: nitroreductase family protein [Salinivirgaceae bacterium]